MQLSSANALYPKMFSLLCTLKNLSFQVRDTKRGEEELTREIPNVSEEATKDLDENGVIRIVQK